jgi:hypothetical protein
MCTRRVVTHAIVAILALGTVHEMNNLRVCSDRPGGSNPTRASKPFVYAVFLEPL